MLRASLVVIARSPSIVIALSARRGVVERLAMGQRERWMSLVARLSFFRCRRCNSTRSNGVREGDATFEGYATRALVAADRKSSMITISRVSTTAFYCFRSRNYI